jgi:hypothetical protein
MALRTVTSTILASVLGITIFAAGQLSRSALSLTELGQSALVKGLAWVVYIVIPNLNAVDIKPAVVGETTPDWALIAAWGGYLAAYTVLALVIASWLFSRKEF